MPGRAGSEKPHSRVLIFNRFYWPDESATAQILTDLAEHLGSSGFEVHVITSRLRYETTPRAPKLAHKEIRRGVCIHRLWSTSFGRAGLIGRLIDYLSIYISFFYFLLRVPRADDIVIMKTDPPLLSILGWIAGWFRPFHFVAWCQDLFPEVAEHAFAAFPGKRFLFGTLTGLRNLSLNACDRVVVISEDMAGMLRQIGIKRPIVILPNWAIQENTHENPDYQALREEWGLSGRIVLGYSGNLGRAHDVETIIEALPELVKLERLTLLFIGGGKGYVSLQERTSSSPAGFLRFLPYQAREHLGQSLKVPHFHWFSLQPAMTAHVSPSKFYGILEAGRPMIFLGAPDSSLARTISDSGCGLVVPSGDPQQLVGAVCSLYSDAQRREQMGAAAKGLAGGEYSRANRLRQWEQCLLSLNK